MDTGTMVFLGVVFAAVFLLFQGLMLPAVGDGARLRRSLQRRLAQINAQSDQQIASILREKYLTQLSPLERQLEELPFMDRLAKSIEQAGLSTLAYRVVLSSVLLCIGATVVSWWFFKSGTLGLLAGALALWVPYLRITLARRRRLDKIEEQLPDAIDMIKRALRAGHPLTSAIKLVAEDMDQPIAGEFEQASADLNYGNDLRRSMLGLLSRVPSVSVMAMVTAVLVQKETGGNLAEILEQISMVIRGRFRFHRKVRTLSAEGRISAWILALIPLGLFALLSISSPSYLPILLKHPIGHRLLEAAGVLAVIGIYWVRRIIRIEV